MLCILHEVWGSSFTISKNKRTAGLVQNQGELLPVFSPALSAQPLGKPELGTSIVQSPLPTLAISS